MIKGSIANSLVVAALFFASEVQADPDVDKGKQVFETIGCMTCHGATGAGDGAAAAALEPKPRNFNIGDFKYDTDGDGKAGTETDLLNVISEGAAKFGGSQLMVAYGPILPEADRKAIVKYILTLKKK